MNIKDFNEKYRDKGGFAKLYEMMSELESHNAISEHFGVTREAMRSWPIELLGKPYDPRMDRREVRINAILEFMKEYSEYESKVAFQNGSKEYFAEALFLAYKQGVYPRPEQPSLFEEKTALDDVAEETKQRYEKER